MKKNWLWCAIVLLSVLVQSPIQAANLIQVYEQALLSDPIYQQAISQRLANQEGVPISLAGLLPSANIQANPTLTKQLAAGNTLEPPTDTIRGYTFSLSISQTIFDFGKFANLRGARALSKQADAVLNDATQKLMLRVSEAYFAILKDEENLIYNEANKAAFAKQLDQINQQFKVGLKTITDVYTAKASYDTASANYIAAQTVLTNDKENLRAITGVFYPSLAPLSERFPLISPHPTDIEAWVQTAQQQNWAIKSAEYATQAASAVIKQQFAGHLPVLNAQGGYNINYARDTGGSVISPPGPYKIKTSVVGLSLNMPIFSGGLVVAKTNQARYQYQIASQQFEQAVRTTANMTRKSYLGVISGIKQIQADKQAVKSTISSLEGLTEGYRVGTQTLVDVLNQQQRVFQTQTQYATDRYAYIKNLLELKYAAGTLSQQDLEAVNAWLLDDRV